ncbi:MAG: hypothetical protein M3Y25_04275 [Thermoproteota archaeon]|nr:hypothetical protein [Thermoproteota archaeon]
MKLYINTAGKEIKPFSESLKISFQTVRRDDYLPKYVPIMPLTILNAYKLNLDVVVI